MPEMFYVQIKPYPIGFTLNTKIRACYCDPVLDNDILSIISCNINDTTILRLLIVGYLPKLSINHIHMIFHLDVILIIAYHTHHISICQILIHNASLTGLVCCMESVNKVLVQCLDHHSVNTVQIIMCLSLYQ